MGYTFAVLSVIVLMIGVALFASSNADAIVLSIAVASLAVVLAPAIFTTNYSLEEPLTFVIASVVLGFTLKAFYLVAFTGQNVTVDEKLLLGLNIQSLVFGGIVILTGLASFSVGYLFVRKHKTRKRARPGRIWSTKKLILWSTFITAVSFIGFILFAISIGAVFDGFDSLSAKRFRDDDGAVTASRTGTIDYLLYRIALLAKFPLYLLFVHWILTRFPFFSFVGAMMFFSGFLALFVPFFVNNRAGVLLPIVDLVILGVILTGRVNLRFLISVGSIAAVLVFAGGYIRSGGDFSGFYNQVFGGRYLIDITKTAHIVNYFNDTGDWLLGLSLVSWIYKIFPLFTPPLPELQNIGFYLGYVVFGYPQSGVPPGIIAELFINYGWYGLVIGMFLFGVLLKKIYVVYGLNATNIEQSLVYTLICTRFTVFLFNNGLSIALLKTALDLIALYMVFILVRAPRKRHT